MYEEFLFMLQYNGIIGCKMHLTTDIREAVFTRVPVFEAIL